MEINISRTLRPQPYESLSFSITASAADFPEAAELTALDLRDYLHYQAAKAVAYFEIANGGDKTAITSHVQKLHQFLKISRLGPLLVPPQELDEPAPLPPAGRQSAAKPPAAAAPPAPGPADVLADPYERYPGFPAPNHG